MAYEYTLETMDGPEVCTYSWDDYLVQLKRQGIYQYPEHERKFHDEAVEELEYAARTIAEAECYRLEDELRNAKRPLEKTSIPFDNTIYWGLTGVCFHPTRDVCEKLGVEYPYNGGQSASITYGTLEDTEEDGFLILSVRYRHDEIHNPCWFGDPIDTSHPWDHPENIWCSPAVVNIYIPLAQFIS